MECDDEIWANASGFWTYHRSENAQVRTMITEGYITLVRKGFIREIQTKIRKLSPSIQNSFVFLPLLFFFP